MRTIALCVALLVATPALGHDDGDGPEHWTWTDSALQGTFLTLMTISWRQNLSSRGRAAWERNPLLGDAHPSATTVNSAFLTVACLHTLGALALPPRWRHIWQGVGIGFAFGDVAHNFSVGVGGQW